jgi:hypothetical protein
MEPNVRAYVKWLVDEAYEGNVWLPDIGSDAAVAEAKKLGVEYSDAVSHPDHPTLKKAQLPKNLELFIYEHNESFAVIWKKRGKKPLLFITYKEFDGQWMWIIRSPHAPTAPKPPQDSPRRGRFRSSRSDGSDGWFLAGWFTNDLND